MIITSTNCSPRLNEISSVKFAIIKALKRNTYSCNSKTGYLKTICVDLPLSQDTFDHFFNKLIPQTNHNERQTTTIKCKVSINDLKTVLGRNWYIYNVPNSSIRQRILGLIQVNYRTKELTITSTNYKR